MEKNKLYFLSDAHLGSYLRKDKNNEEKLIEFLNSIKNSAKELYLVGDIFDFWFEYKNVVPSQHFELLFALHDLIKSGTRVVYVAGNHDFWRGDFLSKKVGIKFELGSITKEIGDKKIFICHGDEFLDSALNYSFLKKILRNKFNNFLYRLIHPDLGIPLAKLVAKKMRSKVDKKLDFERLSREYRMAAERFLQRSDFNVVILAHTHKAEFYRVGDKIYINLGNWISDFDYAVFENGEFSLKKF